MTEKRKPLPPDLKRERPGVEVNTPEWAQWIREIEHYLGFPICGRKAGRSDGYPRPCPSPLKGGRTACRMHGGSALRGPQNPAWLHGKSSIFADQIPDRLQESYRVLMEDPKILALENEIVLTDLRLLEMVRCWRDGMDPAAACSVALTQIQNARVAIAEDDTDALGSALDAAQRALEQGAGSKGIWDEIDKLQERRRKMVDTEGKRLERMQAFITAEEARAYNQMVIAVITNSAKATLPDELSRTFLSRVYEGVMHIGGGQPKRQVDRAQLPAHIQAREGKDEA